MATMLTIVAPLSPAAAANVLSNASVSPESAMAGTQISFSVHYASSAPPRAATAVWADLVRTSDGATARVDLVLVEGGDPRNDTWTRSTPLLAGTWAVTFRATADQSSAVPDLSYPNLITVTPAATATPSPTPVPTPTPTTTAPPTGSPTPQPTSGPTASPAPQPSNEPPGPTPAPGASQPPPTSGTPPASSSPGTATPSVSMSSSPSPIPRATESSAASPATESASPSPGEGETAGGSGTSVVPWLVLGGGMATAGATVLAVQWAAWRRRPHHDGRPPPTGPG